MNQPEIQLFPSEIFDAAIAGIMREVENLKKGRTPAHGVGHLNSWQIHIEGCLGEKALAKYKGWYWSGKGKLRGPDVAGVDVRTADSHNKRLILHREDPDERAFWLLTGVNGKYRIRGWCYGHEGKKEEFWEDPQGTNRYAFFVPHHILRDPEE